jgi:hypothetical protein
VPTPRGERVGRNNVPSDGCSLSRSSPPPSCMRKRLRTQARDCVRSHARYANAPGRFRPGAPAALPLYCFTWRP